MVAVRAIGGLLVLIGLVLAGGGAWLAGLGGSPYYLIAGLACLAAGALIWRRNFAGVRIYAALVAGTILWALWEVGAEFWLLLPRLVGPLVILAVMLTPWFRAGFAEKTAKARFPQLVGLAGAAALLAGQVSSLWQGKDAAPVATVAAVSQPVPDWADYAGNKSGTRFSPAAQITPANVAKLELAWTYHTGDLPQKHPASLAPYMSEVTPLQIGTTLYLCTPRDIVIALDADSGKELWRHNPKVDDSGVFTLACRGVAWHQSSSPAATDCPRRILVATVDGRMIALNADTGKRCAGFGRNGEISLREGLGTVAPGFQFNTSPAMIVGDAAIVGGFVLDNMTADAPSGVVRAFNAVTGAQMWGWDAGQRDPNAVPRPGETYVRGSPNAWSLFSADEKLGLVYVPTGNPSPDHFGGQRSAEMERFGSSVVALDAATGKRRWSFQTVHHDLWDYDVGSQPVLVDMPMGGTTVPALIQATKQGEIFLLDRRDGKPLAPVREMAVPPGTIPGERYAPTQPTTTAFESLVPPALREAHMWGATPLDQLWCRIAFRRLKYRGRYTPPSLADSLIYPGNSGVMNWGSLAVDPVRQIMIVPTSYMPMTLRLIPRKAAPATDGIAIEGQGAISPMQGTPFAVRTERPFSSPLGIPCNAPPWGKLTAIDLKSRKIVWQRPLGTTADHAPLGIAVPGVFNQGGAMITGGGLAFIGATLDNVLRGFDVRTGKELWKARLPAGGQALPMSYVSPRTGRQYVVIAAGGHQFMDTRIGDAVLAYRLGE